MNVQRKVNAAGAGGALGTIIAWAVGQIFGIEVSEVVGGAFATFFAWLLGYLVPN
jgi:hypothetical protein